MARKLSADKTGPALSLCLLLGACNPEKPASAEADSAPRQKVAAHADGPAPSHEASPTPKPAPPASARPCPRYRPPAARGSLREPHLDEISGIARSRLAAHFWVHNDSGDEARVYALSPSASWLATYRLEGVPKPKDVEDLAVVTHGGRARIYLGDIGDNERRRGEILVHRFDEPDLAQRPTNLLPARERMTGPVTTVRLTYPDGAHDSEAFLIDPESEAIVVLTKSIFGLPRVYVRGTFTDGALTLAGEMSPEVTGVTIQLATAVDVTAAGDYIAVRTYDGAYLFSRAPGQAIPEALTARACSIQMAPEKQGEALALIDRPGQPPDIATMSEGKVTTLWITEPE